MRIGYLSSKYEGGGPATISTGSGDSGGVSYGTYQLATNTGSVDSFINWLQQRGDFGRDYGNQLAKFEPGTREFSAEWLALANVDPEGFGRLQDEYVMPGYYGEACEQAEKLGVNTSQLPEALQMVLFSNAIQHGAYWAGRLLAESFNDDAAQWIRSVYDTKLSDPSWTSGCTSADVLYGVRNRWENEKQDALAILAGG